MSDGANNEITSSRVFNVPRERLYTAFADPAQVALWWGPAGFTNTIHDFDLRPGGKWLFTMHGPDKGNYLNECVFLKVDPPSLIAWDRVSKPLFGVVATFRTLSSKAASSSPSFAFSWTDLRFQLDET